MQEPSVLDYLKSKLAPWKYPPVTLADGRIDDSTVSKSPIEITNKQITENASVQDTYVLQQRVSSKSSSPWRALAGLIIALLAQFSLEARPGRSWQTGVFLFVVSAGLITWSIVRNEWQIATPPEDKPVKQALTVKILPLVVGLVLVILTFLMSGGNRFTWLNISLLISSLGLLGFAFWQPGSRDWWKKILVELEIVATKAWWKNNWHWIGLIGGVFILAAYYRFANLAQVPPEMNSDHAEKIIDSLRVTLGQTLIFFPNNG